MFDSMDGIINKEYWDRLVLLSGVRASLLTKESQVQFPVRASAWGHRPAPGRGA